MILSTSNALELGERNTSQTIQGSKSAGVALTFA